MYSSTTGRTTAALTETVHAERDWVACCCVVLGFPCLYDAPPYRAAGTGPFDPSRLSRFGDGPVRSPTRPCAMWDTGGAVARPRAVA